MFFVGIFIGAKVVITQRKSRIRVDNLCYFFEIMKNAPSEISENCSFLNLF